MEPLALSANLKEFIRSTLSLRASHDLNSTTKIVGGLKIEAADCDQLMEAFFKTFQVERGDYDFLRYFEPEAFLHPTAATALTKWFYRRKGIELYPEKESMTLAMLQHAIELGVWDTEKLRATQKE